MLNILKILELHIYGFLQLIKALEENSDIDSTPFIFERMEHRLKIRDTDNGRELQTQIDDLKSLLQAFRDGVVKEDHRKQ